MRSVFAVVVVFVLAAHAEHVRAQVTLLVRDDASLALDAATGADEALRSARGGSVRRLDSSLEEMALAVGCPDAPQEPACVAMIASAAHAQSVAIEQVSRRATGWRVTLERAGVEPRGQSTPIWQWALGSTALVTVGLVVGAGVTLFLAPEATRELSTRMRARYEAMLRSAAKSIESAAVPQTAAEMAKGRTDGHAPLTAVPSTRA
jgi:hypothetical protein